MKVESWTVAQITMRSNSTFNLQFSTFNFQSSTFNFQSSIRDLSLYRYLLYTTLVAATLERGLEELVHDGGGCLVVDETTWHDQYVGIVVLAAEMSYLWNPSQAGTHTLMLVERDADALATAANGNAGINLAALDALAKRMAEVGIVAAEVTVCAVVLVGISMLFQILKHKLLQCEACMVAGYSYCLYFHNYPVDELTS